MNLHFLDPTVKNQQDEPGKHTLVTHEPQYESMEGSEFLDDAIRMKEQPLMIHTEDSSAAAGEN